MCIISNTHGRYNLLLSLNETKNMTRANKIISLDSAYTNRLFTCDIYRRKQNNTHEGVAFIWLNPHEVIQPRETSGWVQNGQVWVQAGASILNRVQFERDKSIKQTRKGFLKTFEQLYLFQKNKLLL